MSVLRILQDRSRSCGWISSELFNFSVNGFWDQEVIINFACDRDSPDLRYG